MSMNGKIRVKYVGNGEYDFEKGKIYDAYQIKSDFKHKSEFLGVVDDSGEEYMIPRKWFEIVEE